MRRRGIGDQNERGCRASALLTERVRLLLDSQIEVDMHVLPDDLVHLRRLLDVEHVAPLPQELLFHILPGGVARAGLRKAKGCSQGARQPTYLLRNL